MASLTAALASVLAFPAAYTLAFNVSAGTRRMLMFLLIVPFFTSYPIRIYSWQIFFSPSGIINRLLNSFGAESISILDTSAATLIGYLTLTLPLVILVQTFALVNVDQRLLEAAYNLGCNRWRTILTVLIPSARVGLTLAATFTFILSFGDYISPMFLGGSKPPTLSILITDQVKSGNHWPRASVVAVTMVITLVLVLLAATAIAYPRARRST
jgi:ABC-type spermidine/putrescine transport system permease subunit I